MTINYLMTGTAKKLVMQIKENKYTDALDFAKNWFDITQDQAEKVLQNLFAHSMHIGSEHWQDISFDYAAEYSTELGYYSINVRQAYHTEFRCDILRFNFPWTPAEKTWEVSTVDMSDIVYRYLASNRKALAPACKEIRSLINCSLLAAKSFVELLGTNSNILVPTNHIVFFDPFPKQNEYVKIDVNADKGIFKLTSFVQYDVDNN